MKYTFRKIYPDLEQDRWFFTVWVALPEESREVIREKLQPLLPYCEWVSTLSGNHSKDIPHISLRYLGFSDELNHEDVKKDKLLFEKALKNVSDMEIELGDMGLWTVEENGKVKVARLNWKILKPGPFINLHKALLQIPQYDFFEKIENDNYTPHISLGAVDMSSYDNYIKVKDYLEQIPLSTHKFVLKDFALNLTAPTHTEVVPLHYNV